MEGPTSREAGGGYPAQSRPRRISRRREGARGPERRAACGLRGGSPGAGLRCDNPRCLSSIRLAAFCACSICFGARAVTAAAAAARRTSARRSLTCTGEFGPAGARGGRVRRCRGGQPRWLGADRARAAVAGARFGHGARRGRGGGACSASCAGAVGQIGHRRPAAVRGGSPSRLHGGRRVGSGAPAERRDAGGGAGLTTAGRAMPILLLLAFACRRWARGGAGPWPPGRGRARLPQAAGWAAAGARASAGLPARARGLGSAGRAALRRFGRRSNPFQVSIPCRPEPLPRRRRRDPRRRWPGSCRPRVDFAKTPLLPRLGVSAAMAAHRSRGRIQTAHRPGVS